MGPRLLLISTLLAGGCSRSSSAVGTEAERAEAEQNLAAIARGATAYHAAHGEYPKGGSGITPAEDCCHQDGHRCQPYAPQWQGGDFTPLWPMLEFSIEAPHRFQYTYRSDGVTFSATALGDLDCDEDFVEYQMEGAVEDGQPTARLIRPAPSDSD